MERKLVVSIPKLTPAQTDAIRDSAARHGLTALFFPDASSAAEAAREAEILFGPDAVLAREAKGLRWFSSSTAGVNQFAGADVFASPDAVLTNSSGAYGVTIAEHTLMLLLEVLRRQPEYTQIVSRREWKRDLPVRSVFGSRVTLLGTGDIGREAAKRLRAFGPASLTGVNRGGANPENLFDRVLPVSRLSEILPETDILIASLPGTPETFHLLDGKALPLLPDGAVIVNVGRGSLLDEAALEKELRAGRLYAALDVFEQEPLPAASALWNCPNLLITPHAAGNMTLAYTADRIVAQFLENLERYCAGEPLKHTADLKKGY